jgi:thiol-disulfide isomerase/thioredoxin
MKKFCFVCGLLGSFLILSSVEAAFTDVPSNHPNYEAINYVQAKDIVEGYSDGTFKPDITINRAELTKIIMATEFESDLIENCNVYSTNLSDVPAEAWFASFVCTAKANAVIDGYDDGTFKPAQNVTFVEAAKIISLGFGQDLPTNAALWYQPYVDYLSEQSAIPESVTAVAKNITRGEMAEIIYRLHAAVSSRPAQAFMEGALTPMTDEIKDQIEANVKARESAAAPNPASASNATSTPPTNQNSASSSNTNSGDDSTNAGPSNPMVCQSCPTGFIGQPTNSCACERGYIYEQTYPIEQCGTIEFTCGAGYEYFADTEMCGCKIKEEVVEYWLTSDSSFKLNALDEYAPIVHGSYEELNAGALESALGNKNIVLFFHAPWCPQCVSTDTEIKERIRELPEDTIIFKTDYDSEIKLREKFEITSQHSIVIIDKNNALQFKQTGFNFDDIVSVIEKIKEAEALSE